MSLQFDVKLERREFILSLQGEFGKGAIGIFGPSGAGKSSFFNLLLGLERPDYGRIILNGRVLSDSSKKTFVPVQKRRIGMVFQDKRLFPHLSVKENLLFGVPYAVKRNVELDQVNELLNLQALQNSFPHQISGGEQQRVAIGRALMCSPELLLLDEPFNAVDNSLRYTMLPYLKSLRDELDIPMLIISHDLPDLQKLTRQVYLIEKGQNRGFGDILELFSQGNPVTRRSSIINHYEVDSVEQKEMGLYSCILKVNSRVNFFTPQSPSGWISLMPKDVSLSSHELKGSSIQNQLPGQVTRIFRIEKAVYCVVEMIEGDVSITSEITEHSIKEMDLKVGSKVFCLFKAHSLIS